jgi:hypothetical protein
LFSRNTEQELEEEGLGAFSQLQEQMNAIMQQVRAVRWQPPKATSHPLLPATLLQASSKIAALKEENDGLKSQVTLLMQPKQPASMASAASGALDDAEPEFLDDSEEASSECTGTAGSDSRRSSCVSALESCRDSLIDSSGATSRDASMCDDGSGDASVLSAHDCSPAQPAALPHSSVSLSGDAGASLSSPPQPAAPAIAPHACSPSPIAAECFVGCADGAGDAGAQQGVPSSADGACGATAQGVE